MTRRKVLLTVLLSFVLGGVCGWFLPRLAPKPPSEPPPEPGPPVINSGFFFYRGAYLSPPYYVTLDEDGVKINGICVRRAWRPPPPGRPIPKVDPGPFKWTPELEKKGMSASGFNRHAIQRFRYWKKHHGYREACRRFEEYLKQQPLVARTEVRQRGVFTILYWTKDGEQDGFGFSPLKPLPNKERLEQNRASLRHDVQSFSARLRRGGAVFLGGPGFGDVFVPAGRARLEVRRIREILISDQAADWKAKQLVAEDLVTPPLEYAHLFVKTFRDVPSLAKRLELSASERERLWQARPK